MMKSQHCLLRKSGHASGLHLEVGHVRRGVLVGVPGHGGCEAGCGLGVEAQIWCLLGLSPLLNLSEHQLFYLYRISLPQ